MAAPSESLDREPVEKLMAAQTESQEAEIQGSTDFKTVDATPVNEPMHQESTPIATQLETSAQDQDWKDVSFSDPEVKFAVLKRVMQLTGTRIPDNAIKDITNAKALVGHLVKKPKPKKLAEILLVSESLASLPNLHIMDRRYTPIDREKEVGRWKVIEKELEKGAYLLQGGHEGPVYIRGEATPSHCVKVSVNIFNRLRNIEKFQSSHISNYGSTIARSGIPTVMLERDSVVQDGFPILLEARRGYVVFYNQLALYFTAFPPLSPHPSLPPPAYALPPIPSQSN